MKPRAGTLVEEVLEILAASEEPLTRTGVCARSEIAADEQDVSGVLHSLKARGEIVAVDQVPNHRNQLAWRYALPGSACLPVGMAAAEIPLTPDEPEEVVDVRTTRVSGPLADIAGTVDAEAVADALIRDTARLVAVPTGWQTAPNDRSDDDPAPRSALPAGRQAATPDMRFGVFDDGSLEIWSGTEILCRFDAQVVERLGQLLGRHAR